VKKSPLALLGCAAVLLGACGSSEKAAVNSRSAAKTTAAPTASVPLPAGATNVVIDPKDFVTSTQITNKYMPMKPGAGSAFDGTRDGVATHTEKFVTKETKVIKGVTCVVLRDTVTSNGGVVELTSDWFAQSTSGDVWYFGEDTKEYTNGVVSSTHGTWEAGVDGAQPGIVMRANPKPGDTYYQEMRPGEAEDKAKILAIDGKKAVPTGTFTNLVVTEDSDPLNPDKTDEKYYAPGVGLIYAKRIRSGHQEELAYTKTITGQ